MSAEYDRIYQNGTRFHSGQFVRTYLTTNKLKIKPKESDIAGLQIADLLAFTTKFDVLIENGIFTEFPDVFSPKIKAVIDDKYDRHPRSGRIRGCGRVLL